MNTRPIDIVRLVCLMIVLNIVIAEDRVLVKSNVQRDAVDTIKDVTTERENVAVCIRIVSNPSLCPCKCDNSSLTCCNLKGPYPLPPDLCGSYTCPATH